MRTLSAMIPLTAIHSNNQRVSLELETKTFTSAPVVSQHVAWLAVALVTTGCVPAQLITSAVVQVALIDVCKQNYEKLYIHNIYRNDNWSINKYEINVHSFIQPSDICISSK